MPHAEPPIESVTTASLRLALDVATLRHAAHVGNIANATVADYRRMSVEVQGLSPARAELARHGRLDPAALAAVRLQLNPAPADATGTQPSVRADQEMAELNANSLRYQVLVNALNQHLGLLDLAVADGKR